MPLDKSIKKVLVIGSGPITIGQAAEFDYAGTQACRALKEDKLEVVLVNSNPATIMTDEQTADRVYIEPLTVEILEKIIEIEKPDSLLPTLGGQTGLNLSVALAECGILKKHGVKLIGTEVETIKTSEDRELFKDMMLKIGEPVAESIIATKVEEAVAFSRKAGFPLVVRPAFTLGGSGGGVAYNEEELVQIAEKGLSYSVAGQVLIEQSLLGWKEIEYEVMRDKNDNCITICNMENMDPVGVHTGDSIVVVPSQTLTDKEYQMLRTAAIKIIRSLKIEGGCNIQFALDTGSMKYYIIEVNPRVSRSSALASKAAGYPIARIAAKIAIGYTLDEIKNPITQSTTACFEPTLDYVVVKIPRWPFDKFKTSDRRLTTQMKATGEVMTIDRSFEAALMKAVRSLEIGPVGLYMKALKDKTDDQLLTMLKYPDDLRLWALSEALRREIDAEQLSEVSGINIWFVKKVQNIIALEKKLVRCKGILGAELLREAKEMGYSDREIAALTGHDEKEVRGDRRYLGIQPSCKTVDTCAAEFEASTAYYYSTYDQEDEVEPCQEKNIVVLGSGSIRIGQGIEFDYCAVHSSFAIKKLGYKSIIINNNPETVSTDYDTSDRLYFEPIYIEDILNVVEREKPLGIIAQFGGQTAINAVKELSKYDINILGSDFSAIDAAEDRKKFDALLNRLGIKRPEGISAVKPEAALEGAVALGYPVLVRPSYVIGGQSMRLIENTAELIEYLHGVQMSEDQPLLIDKYVEGVEAEVDALCDGERIFIPGIMQHIERTGIHSGDSMSVFPSISIGEAEIGKIVEITEKIALGLKAKGLINIQYALKDGEVYVIEANPRASRTVPIISKVTGIPMVDIATRIMLGEKLADMSYGDKYRQVKGIYAVKAPAFSFEKIPALDSLLGPEMKSTGEVMGVDAVYEAALVKAFMATGSFAAASGEALVAVPEKESGKWSEVLDRLTSMGYQLTFMGNPKDGEGDNAASLLHDIKKKRFKLVLSCGSDYFNVRRAAVESKVICLTSLDTAQALFTGLQYVRSGNEINVKPLQDYRI